MTGSNVTHAQGSSCSVHELGPVSVVPARGWKWGDGTHVGALNDDVLEEVFKRLPPRALAMAGMVREVCLVGKACIDLVSVVDVFDL